MWLGDAKAAFLLFLTGTMRKKEREARHVARQIFFLRREAGASPSPAREHGLRNRESAAHVEIQSESVSSAEITMVHEAPAPCTYARRR